MVQRNCHYLVCLALVITGCSMTEKFASKPQKRPQTVTSKPGSPDFTVSTKLKDPVRTRLAYAAWHEHSENYSEARDAYKKVLETSPKEIEALLGLARIDRVYGRMDQADAGLRKALKCHPKDPRVLLAIGQVHAENGEYAEAIEKLEAAVELAPYENVYKFHLAVVETRAGEITAGLEHFTRAVGKAEAHFNVGYILNEQGKLADAERHLSIALSMKPDLKQAETTLAGIRAARSDSIQPVSFSKKK